MSTLQNKSVAKFIIACTLITCAAARAYDAWPSDFEWILPQTLKSDSREISYRWRLNLSPSYYRDANYGVRLYLSLDQVFDTGDFLLFDFFGVARDEMPAGATGFNSTVTLRTMGTLFPSLPRSGTYYIFLEIWPGYGAPEDTNNSNNAVMAPNPIRVEGLGTIFYVDDDATGSNDGSSWTNAYNYLQDALAAAGADDEIRVAQGSYTPDRSSSRPDRVGDRGATFQLKNGVALTGGYAGFGEPDANGRDIERYKTLLSGDLSGNDVGGPDDPSRSENSYHVVTGSGTDETAVLDGFTISAGNADGSEGGGMVNRNGKPTLVHCAFVGSSAKDGGGIHNGNGSSPTLMNCRFSGNVANRGGGMCNHLSEPVLTNCVFSGNVANTGGGMYDHATSSPVLTNCTFSGNSATDRGGGVCDESGSILTLHNCILWVNAPDQVSHDAASQISIAYSNVQGGSPGEGNIDVDPLFAYSDYWDTSGTPHDPTDDFWVDGDYHLKSEAGRWDPNARTWVVDNITSPCIDAADPGSPVGDESAPNGGHANMGAYGNTTEASRSPRVSVSVEDFETGDFSEFGWAFYGDASWTVTSGISHSGTYSARAGSILDDGSSTLSVTLDCVAGEISFYYKVSSESDFDSLQFYIDGDLKGEWSGEHDWAQVTFPVTAGTRTFEWVYSKDGSVSEGDDTAWIDDIALPVEPGTAR